MISRDTFKQQRLSRLLQERGHEGGWRAWLRKHHAQPVSASHLACVLYSLTGMSIDPTTLLVWIKQAAAETRHAEKTATAPEAQKQP